MDVEESIQSVSSPHPLIVGLGESLNNLVDILVVDENNVLTIPNLMTAVHSCLACYYLFNIAYPPKMKAMGLFLEAAYQMKPSAKIPLHLQEFLKNYSMTIEYCFYCVLIHLFTTSFQYSLFCFLFY